MQSMALWGISFGVFFYGLKDRSSAAPAEIRKISSLKIAFLIDCGGFVIPELVEEEPVIPVATNGELFPWDNVRYDELLPCQEGAGHPSSIHQ